MTLTSEQQSALNAIITFIASDTSVFILKGYAGTGKTTLLKSLLEHLQAQKGSRPYMLFAPTGRAAKVLQDKTQMGCTIHKGIYTKKTEEINYSEDENFELSVDTENQVTKLVFKLVCRYKYDKPIVIVDESSMISSKTDRDERFQFGSDNLMDDLIEFAGLENGGQIIFIGDDAQLPPVTDSFSAALSGDFFRQKRISFKTASLTQVMRQGKGSLILENAMTLRDNIFKERKDRFNISLRKSDGEFSDIAPATAIIECARDWENTIIITYSNADAAKYNAAIRKIRFPEHPEPVAGDKLLVVRNVYNICNNEIGDEISMFNGEFCYILDVGGEETKIAFVGEDRVELRFRDVKIRHESGNIVSVKIFSGLLDSPSPNITDLESKALFSEFFNRHRHLSRKEYRDEFLLALHHDPYFNAIQVKYGYAITCHKAQGGEWDNVIVDFTGRKGLDTQSLRWTYTALTRATKRLMMANYANASPLSSLDIKATQSISAMEPECQANEQTSTLQKTPYHSDSTAPCKRIKFFEVSKILRHNETITNVISKDWQESYSIQIGEKVFRYDTVHDKKGTFRPFVLITKPITPEATELLLRLNTPPKPDSSFEYTPSTSSLEYLENIVMECASQCDVLVTNIVEHPEQYYVNYYFFTTTYQKIQFYFNEKGNITTAVPFSPSTTLDEAFEKLLKMIADSRG